MIIVWRGLGLPIVMAGALVIGLIVALFDLHYLMAHVWPRLFAFGTGGAVVYLLAWLREKEGPRRDLLYFIPMKVWAIILLAFGICWAFLPASSTIVAAKQISGTQTAATAAKPNPKPIKVAVVKGLQLHGIFYNPNGHTTAIINNTTVSAGAKVGDFTVSAIERELVKLQAADGNEIVLRLSDPGR